MMKILVLNEARTLETGYHYTNAAAIIGILGSGVMKATNRKIGLEQSRIFPSGLKELLINLLKPVKNFSKEERELIKKYREITKRLDKAKEEQSEVKFNDQEKYDFLTNKIKDYKKEIKKLEKLSNSDLSYLTKLINKYISDDDLQYFKSHIKNSDKITLKDAIENNLIDKRIAFMIDVDKIKAESWDRDIIRRELGQASEKENSFGVRNSGDNMYKNKSWSYTRSNIPVHSVKIKPELVRLTLDIEKISQRQPVDSFAWRKVSKNSKETEVEERVVGDTPNIGKYIKSIDFPEEVFDNESKYLTYKKGSSYATYADDFSPLYSFSLDKLKEEIKSIKDTGKFPYYNSIIKGLANGVYELKPVKDYFIKAIENDLASGKIKGISDVNINVKNNQIKTFDSLIKFIENSSYTSFLKKPGGKNKKKIIHKLNIKIGTFKFTKNRSWEYSIPKNLLEEINDMIIFYKTGKMPKKKIVAPPKEDIKPKEVSKKPEKEEIVTTKDTEVLSKSDDKTNPKENDIKQPTVKPKTGYISYDLAKAGLEKLGNHLGKIYIVGSEKNGKINWSNFLLSNNLDKDLQFISSQLEKGETLKIILPKDLTSKMKRPPLRNQERAISQQLYLPDLMKLTHSNSEKYFFKTLEEFIAFIHHQFHVVNNFGKTLKIGICTGVGGITITIKKGVIGAKHTPDFC